MRYNFSKIIHEEGYVFIVICAAATFLLAAWAKWLGLVGFFVTVWCAYFFRDPDRFTPVGDNLVISPADGVVKSVGEASPPPELGLGGEAMCKISIFLGLFDVHVNRCPITGKVLLGKYNPGKFFNASLDKASIYNERQSVLLEAMDGTKVVVVQIAGIIAKRIVCKLEEGGAVKAGQRYGIIRFGSRVDIYLPKNIIPLVCQGQIVVGGETVFARLGKQDVDVPKFEIR